MKVSNVFLKIHNCWHNFDILFTHYNFCDFLFTDVFADTVFILHFYLDNPFDFYKSSKKKILKNTVFKATMFFSRCLLIYTNSDN